MNDDSLCNTENGFMMILNAVVHIEITLLVTLLVKNIF